MIFDARNVDEVPASIKGDTVIVGAGTVGLFLGINLAQANKSVILVEAGGRIANTAGNSKTGESLGKPHTGVLLGRAAGLGGTSVLWGGQLAEFDEADLTQQGMSWPIRYTELRRWYDHVYKVLGITGQLGNDVYQRAFGGEVDAHPSIERFFTSWLPQPNFAKLFHRELLSNPSLRIVLNAAVNEIRFEGEGAREVWAATREGRRIHINGDNFVFAGGTIENNRFFLTSQRLTAVPWKFSQKIGRSFQDHLIGKVAEVKIIDERRLREFFENGFVNKIKLQPKLRFTPAARRQVTVGVCGFLNFDSSIRANLGNFKRLIRALRDGTTFSEWSNLPGDFWMLSRAFGPLVLRYVRDRRILALFDRGLELHVQVEQVPIENSHIRLLGAAPGSDGLFRAGVDWQLDGGEIEAVHKFAIEADSYLQSLSIARLQIDPLLGQDDVAFAGKLNDNSHQCGGLRMAEAPAGGVTDSNCRVWNTSNVYVAGASVFPTSSHANCTLTALALAARLANTISVIG